MSDARPCARQGCGNRTTDPSGRCHLHFHSTPSSAVRPALANLTVPSASSGQETVLTVARVADNLMVSEDFFTPSMTAPEGYSGTSRSQQLISAFKARMAETGMTVEEMGAVELDEGAWEDAGLDPESAASWARFGITPDEAGVFASQGLRSAHVGYNIKRWGGRPEDYRALKMLVEGSHDGTIGAGAVDTLRDLGLTGKHPVTTEEAKRWRDDDWGNRTAIRLIDAGVTLEEANSAYSYGIELADDIIGVVEVLRANPDVPFEWAVSYVRGQRE